MYETELANLLTSPPVITWSQLTRQIDIFFYFFFILYLCIKCNSNLHTFPEASLKRLWVKHLPNKLNRLYRNFEWGLIYPWMSAFDYNNFCLLEDQWTADWNNMEFGTNQYDAGVMMLLKLTTSHSSYKISFKVSHSLQGALSHFSPLFPSCMQIFGKYD